MSISELVAVNAPIYALLVAILVELFRIERLLGRHGKAIEVLERTLAPKTGGS
ncbi:MAG: hypothetical protein AOA65_0193 [Candidatus Bathyarchaeota archaeon BA1]|nr:MAG: hypothetical protein AOA65_0193 [Candidatus Bathyarchaeota archaeon BA1]